MSDAPVLRIDCKNKIASLNTLKLRCRIGMKGFTPVDKGKEGDKKTPLGIFKLRWGFYRADKLSPPPTHQERPLTWRALDPHDGWEDDVKDSAYNRLIRLPSEKSHETLWRSDGAYDLIIVMSHNDSPPVAGLGSAVFIHVAQADDRDTLGCIAFTPNDMVKLLPHLRAGMTVEVYA